MMIKYINFMWLYIKNTLKMKLSLKSLFFSGTSMVGWGVLDAIMDLKGPNWYTMCKCKLDATYNHIAEYLISLYYMCKTHDMYMMSLGILIGIMLVMYIYMYLEEYLHSYNNNMNMLILMLTKDVGVFITVLIFLSKTSMMSVNLIVMSSLTMLMMMYWQFFSVQHESYVDCTNTMNIKSSMRNAFIMFLIMEMMVFGSLFWGYFHYSLTEIWPPMGITKVDFMGLPLINTCLLLSSAISLTVYHNYITMKNHNEFTSVIFLELTSVIGLIFMFVQFTEYKSHLCFSLSDGIYGSIFYSLTGFHGLHVAIGITMLLAASMLNKYAMYNNHMGITASIWYWHFVDVIWVLLFILVYV